MPSESNHAEEAAAAAVVTELETLSAITKRGGVMRFLSTPATTGSRHHIFGHLVLQPGEEVAEHVHDYGEETLFVLAGRAAVIAGGDRHELRQGQCIFLPRGLPHAVSVEGGETVVAVFASAPLAPSPQVGHRDTGKS